MNFIRFFVHRYVFTTLCCSILCLVGFISFNNIDMEDEPFFKTNDFYIQVSYSGTIDGIRNTIAIPMEKKLVSIPGVEIVKTDISRHGVTFDISCSEKDNYNELMLRIQGAINASKHDVPNEAIVQLISKGSPDETIMSLNFYSDTISISRINNFVIQQVKNLIESVPGVTSVDINSTSIDSYIVSLIPNAMSQHGVTYENFREALHNMALSGSTCNIPIGNSIISINVDYRDQSIDNYPVHRINVSNDDHSNKYIEPVKLKDIANVYKGIRTQGNISRVNNRESVSLSVYKKQEANLIDVCSKIKDKLGEVDEMCKSSDISMIVSQDKSAFVKRGLNSVIKTILEAIVLVCIVVFIFLRSPVLSVIPIVAIPCSLLPTFLFLKILGITMNIYSLFGMVMATGLVVDDAIITLEHAHHLQEKGVSAYDAATKGIGKIAISIIVMTLTLVIVYLPIIFVRDNVVRNFVDFAVSISISVVISAIISLTLTPMMFYMLRKKYDSVNQVAHVTNMQSISYKLEYIYLQLLTYLIKSRYNIFLLLYGLLVVITAIMFAATGYEETIDVDKGYVMFSISGKKDNDIDISYIDNQLQTVTKNIKQSKIKDDVEEIFFNLSASQKHHNFLRLRLKPHSSRKYEINEIVNEVIGIHKQNASDFYLYCDISTKDYKTLRANMVVYESSYNNLMKRFVEMAKDPNIGPYVGGILRTDTKMCNSYSIKIDRELCSLYNLKPTDVLDAFTSVNENRFFRKSVSDNIHKIHIDVMSSRDDKKLDSLLQIPVSIVINQNEQPKRSMLPMRHFVKVEKTRMPNREFRINGIYGLGINFRLNKGINKTTLINGMNKYNKQVYGICNIKADIKEINKIDALKKIIYMFVISIVLVYSIIASLLNSYFKPLAVIATVPVSSLGSMIMLYYFSYRLNTVAIIGLITMIGLVTRHGIMLLDYCEQRKESKVCDELIIEACIARIKPILMTSICMIIGTLPLIKRNTEFSEYKAPIALVLIGGLALGTILTLFVVPCFYVIICELTSGRSIERHNYSNVIMATLDGADKNNLDKEEIE